ncbi:MAG: IPT/TIG domain-containing protein [Anaerolineales bacterium]|nr:IPT/TIG domain-containing protein [Anaerolineales bacterium]
MATRKTPILLPKIILPILLALILLLTAPHLTALAALGISAVTPGTVTNDSAAILTISGADFANGAIVSLDGYAALETSFASATTLTAILPAGVPAGAYTVRVTNPDSASVTLPNGLTVLAPAEPTATTQPQAGYERPLIVIKSYSASVDTISPGTAFTLYVKLENAGQRTANNVTAVFASGDLSPRETGGVIAAGDIDPGTRQEIVQPLTVNYAVWGATVASLTMTVSYTDVEGTQFTETFTITFPLYYSSSAAATLTPTATTTPTVTPTPSRRPQLIISQYSADIDVLQPGSQFVLQVTLQNVGSALARNITMIAGGGSAGGTAEPGGISGSSGDFTNFAPLGSSNVQSLGDLAPDDSSEAAQSLIVNTSINPGAYPFKISFVYNDESNFTYTDEQVITLLVYSLPVVDIGFYMDPGMPMAGQPNMLPMQIVNLGRKTVVLGNMRVTTTSGDLVNNVVLVGALDPGGYFTLDANLTPYMPGPLELLVTVDYTDDFNQPQVISRTLTLEVMEGFIPEQGGMDGEIPIEPEPPAPETFWQKLWRFILGLLGLDSAVQTPDSGMPYEEMPMEEFPEGEIPEGEVPVEVVPVPIKGP